MVKLSGDKLDLTRVDLSIIPSLQCNLACGFCMYNAGPQNTLTLDVEATRQFLATVDWNAVPMCGFYGGEPSINQALYDKFIAMVPKTIQKFVITNGSWTRASEDTAMQFLNWCADHTFRIIISGTPEHKSHQAHWFIDVLRGYEGILVKDDDEIHPMGRSTKANWACTRKCIWHQYGIRLGIFPSGHILMQNCDGVYPVVGNITNNTFADVFRKAILIRHHKCQRGCLNVNDVLEKVEIA